MAGNVLLNQITPSFTRGGNGKLFRNLAIGLAGVGALAATGGIAAGTPVLSAVFNPVVTAGKTAFDTYLALGIGAWDAGSAVVEMF